MDRDELLRLTEQAITDKSINVAAIKLRLEELRRDADDQDTGNPFDNLDEVAEARARKASY